DFAEAIGGERLGAVEHPDDVRVPCDHPGVQWLAPVDGVVVAEPRVERERGLDVSPGLGIEVHRRGGYPAPVTLLKLRTGSPPHPATLRRAPSTSGFPRSDVAGSTPVARSV